MAKIYQCTRCGGYYRTPAKPSSGTWDAARIAEDYCPDCYRKREEIFEESLRQKEEVYKRYS